MHNKFIKIIIAVFIVLAIITAFPWLNDKINKQKTESQTKISVNLTGFTQESVNKISIKKGNDEKILSYKDNKWYVGEDEADEDKMKQLFQDFSQMKMGEMVSQNENNQANFEVNQDTGIELTISQNGKDNIYFVGKVDSATGGFYIRKDGIKNVYLISGNLRDKLIWGADKWKKADKKDESTK